MSILKPNSYIKRGEWQKANQAFTLSRSSPAYMYRCLNGHTSTESYCGVHSCVVKCPICKADRQCIDDGPSCYRCKYRLYVNEGGSVYCPRCDMKQLYD